MVFVIMLKELFSLLTLMGVPEERMLSLMMRTVPMV